MGKRRKSITTINIDPELKELAKLRGINISKVVDEAIRKKLTVNDEKRFIFKEIEKYQYKIDKLEERLSDLDSIQEEMGTKSMEHCINTLKDIYERNGQVIPKTVVEFWSGHMDISIDELYEIIRSEIIEKV
jgi:hypothetical protein